MGLGGSSGTNFTFDGLTDLLAVVFMIPATGTISKVHYRIGSSSSPVCTQRIELRTVDTTTGLPNAAGTLYGSSTSITVANPTTGLKTAAVNCTGATAGDLVALVFDISAFTSGNFGVQQRFGGSPAHQFPYIVTNTTGATAVAVNNVNVIGLEYGTDTFFPMMWNTVAAGPLSQPTLSNTGTSRRGNRIRSAVPRRAVGAYVFGDIDGDSFLRLRLAADDSLLATATLDSNVRGSVNLAGVTNALFDSAATYVLAAGVDYYVLLEGNSATTCSINLINGVPTNAQLDQISGGKNCYGTSWNGGYSDINTSRYGIGILYDGLDDGAGNVAFPPVRMAA